MSILFLQVLSPFAAQAGRLVGAAVAALKKGAFSAQIGPYLRPGRALGEMVADALAVPPLKPAVFGGPGGSTILLMLGGGNPSSGARRGSPGTVSSGGATGGSGVLTRAAAKSLVRLTIKKTWGVVEVRDDQRLGDIIDGVDVEGRVDEVKEALQKQFKFRIPSKLERRLSGSSLGGRSVLSLIYTFLAILEANHRLQRSESDPPILFTSKQFERRLLAFFRREYPEVSGITLNMPLEEVVDVDDSLEFPELAAAIENEFDVVMTGAPIEEMLAKRAGLHKGLLRVKHLVPLIVTVLRAQGRMI